MEDTTVVALAPHEESNFNVPQHAIEEFVQQQEVEDAPVACGGGRCWGGGIGVCRCLGVEVQGVPHVG
jgi:hypothetical protein